MGMYEFKTEDAYRFADSINAETKQRGNNLMFKVCPYCKASTGNNRWSFAINLENGMFKCLRSSCNASGNMITIAKDFNFSLGTNIDEYYTPKKKFRSFPKPKEPIVPKDKAVEYLKSRGISEEIAKQYQITVQTEHENILVFPFFDEHGDMPFIKYRDTEFSKEKGGNKEWCQGGGKPILFGIRQCVPPDINDTLTIAEGQIDSLSIAECGFQNALSVPTGAKGFTWIPYCWDFINRYKKIIVFGDCEKGEITLLKEIKERFNNLAIYHVRTEDYKDCKDANEILQKYGKEQIKVCIENAEAEPIKKVISLAEVQDIDVFSIEKLKTGFKKLDYLLYGGLPFGYLVVLGGKRGLGKSTVGSQIIANAIEQNYISFVYSGELTNSNFKAWLDFQIAGQKNIIEATSRDGGKRWFIPTEKRRKITDWYADKCFIYDSSTLDANDEQEGILETVEKVICRNGARVILLDNLMTALDLDTANNTDKYEKQSKFVKSLVKMALRYNVLIILVAHKRKSTIVEDKNDDISGSADITNLAGVVINYEPDKEVPTDRRLTVTKNRLFGKVNLDGDRMMYEEKSKRVYSEIDDVDFAFGWERNSYGFSNSGETPFD